MIELVPHPTGGRPLPPNASMDALDYPLTPEPAAALGVPQVPHLTPSDLDVVIVYLGVTAAAPDGSSRGSTLSRRSPSATRSSANDGDYLTPPT